MSESKPQFNTVDEYINAFPDDVRALLRTLRETIHEEVPGVEEAIKYGMPTFMTTRNLVHFAAYKRHIGFYPGAAPIQAFSDELSGYRTARGSIQLPIDQPLPVALIRKLVQFRVAERGGR